jgi:rubredoxin
MRQMIWIKTTRMETWACSACSWTFSPSGPPLGRDLEEMKQNFERQRDKEYASHVCAVHPRPSRDRDQSDLSRTRGARPCSANPGNRVGRTDLRRAI